MSIQRSAVDGPSWLDDPALAETVRPEMIATWKAGIARATPEAAARAKAGYTLQEKSLTTLSDGAVLITLCADTGVFSQAPGFSEHRELDSMAKTGMPPLEVIRAATQVGADILGLTDRGTLAPGEPADFIVMDANPLGSMSTSRKISPVYRNGIAIDRAALERALRREG